MTLLLLKVQCKLKFEAQVEKRRLTVMLRITADGHKLPPYIILNSKTIPKDEMFHKDRKCACTKNRWMTADLWKIG
jgi:hypothetical protein